MNMKYSRKKKKWEKKKMSEKIKKVYCFKGRDIQIYSRKTNTPSVRCFQHVFHRLWIFWIWIFSVSVLVPTDYKSDLREVAAISKEEKIL
jgi:hypothetical protein